MQEGNLKLKNKKRYFIQESLGKDKAHTKLFLSDELREQLAELEHEQWQNWSYKIKEELDKIHQLIVNDNGHDARLLISKIRNRWQENWMPYKQLSEKTKEFDRKWADKVLKLVEEYNNKKLKLFPFPHMIRKK